MDEIFGDHSAVHDAQIMDEVQGKIHHEHTNENNKAETSV